MTQRKRSKGNLGRDRLNPARMAAVRIIREVTDDGAFSNESLSRHLSSDHLDARDRAFVTAMVFGVLSELPAIDYAIEQVSSRPLASLDGDVRAILRAGTWQLYFSFHVPARAACDESVRLARILSGDRVTGFVNGVMRQLSRTPRPVPGDAALAAALESGLPEALFQLFSAWYGDERAAAIGAWSKQAPRSLAIRPDARQFDRFEDWIRGEEARSWAPQCLLWPDRAHALVSEGRDITTLSAYRDGLFSVQSQSAMLAAQLLGAGRKDRILDCCAAPGGKTAYIAETTADEAPIDACDVSQKKVDQLRALMKRKRHDNVTCHVLDASQLPSSWDRSFDRVLCDVPCSGLGLLAKRPEIRSHVTPDTIARLLPLQRAILANGARATVPGGTLLYSTCTLSPPENEEQIRAFLASPEGRDFVLDDVSAELPRAVRDAISPRLPGTVLLMPPDMDSDGFYIARLRRRNS